MVVCLEAPGSVAAGTRLVIRGTVRGFCRELVWSAALLRGRGHMNEDEEVQFRWHQCSNCGKVFDSEEALHEHARRCKLDQVVVVGFAR